MATASYSVILLLLVQLVCVSRGTEDHTLCLSCPRVSHPHDCKTFVEIWPRERCSTELFLLLNGSTVYKFGFESATDCPHFGVVASPYVRQKRISITDISRCRECCSENICNRKLCGIHDINNNDLACLAGDEASGVPTTSITYCNARELCYARIQNTRPHLFNFGDFGCASQVVCNHLARVSSGSSTMCQRCCSEDGCNAHICHEQVSGSTTLPIATTQSVAVFTDCWDLRTRGGYQQNGVYDIYPPPEHSRLRVRCDMTTDGGGWIVLQRRFDGSLNFTRTFQEYEEGFGDVSREHWVGLRWIHSLTSQTAVQMRVDMCRVDGRAGYAVYDGFSVSDPGDNYTLRAGAYRNGNILDWLGDHDGREFQVSGQCADRYRGGWWYEYCVYANLNGGHYNGGSLHGIAWGHFGGYSPYPNVLFSELKIRPFNAPGDPAHLYSCPP